MLATLFFFFFNRTPICYNTCTFSDDILNCYLKRINRVTRPTHTINPPKLDFLNVLKLPHTKAPSSLRTCYFFWNCLLPTEWKFVLRNVWPGHMSHGCSEEVHKTHFLKDCIGKYTSGVTHTKENKWWDACFQSLFKRMFFVKYLFLGILSPSLSHVVGVTASSPFPIFLSLSDGAQLYAVGSLFPVLSPVPPARCFGWTWFLCHIWAVNGTCCYPCPAQEQWDHTLDSEGTACAAVTLDLPSATSCSCCSLTSIKLSLSGMIPAKLLLAFQKSRCLRVPDIITWNS